MPRSLPASSCSPAFPTPVVASRSFLCQPDLRFIDSPVVFTSSLLERVFACLHAGLRLPAGRGGEWVRAGGRRGRWGFSWAVTGLDVNNSFGLTGSLVSYEESFEE